MIYIPSFMGIMDALTVESLGYILFDCFRWEAKGYKFFFQIGKRMAHHNARNEAVKWALANNMDYIFWFDDDMVVDKAGKQLFTTLMEHDKDFVAPLFFQRRPPYLPLLFKRNQYLDDVYTTYDNILDYEKGLLEVDGVGFGCCLTKVDMFRKIKPTWFDMGASFGEDLFFCERAKAAGYKVYVDTELQVGHIGDVPIAWEGTFNQNRPAAELMTKQKKDNDIKYMKEFAGEVDICMPIYHNFITTKDAIESIINNTIACSWSLNLVIDGYDKQVISYIKELCKHRDNIKYQINKKSVGCVKAQNQALKMATAPYICLINNDIIVPPNMNHWLHKLIQLLKHDGVGAVAPISDCAAGLQHISYNSKIIGSECYASFLVFFCAVFKREVFEKIGYLDERFQDSDGRSSSDDLDFSIRMTEAKYHLKVARDVFIHHEGSKTLLQLSNNSRKDLDNIHEKFIQVLKDKWGNEKVDKLFKMTLV